MKAKSGFIFEFLNTLIMLSYKAIVAQKLSLVQKASNKASHIHLRVTIVQRYYWLLG